MIVAVWIIAICEIIRAIQNMIQIAAYHHDSSKRDNAYDEFIKSLKHDDAEFVKRMLEGFEKQEYLK